LTPWIKPRRINPWQKAASAEPAVNAKVPSLYHLLLDWQTLIGAMIALVAALVAVRPVWRQVAEMRIQSAMQTYDHLRSCAIAIERERALTWQAKLEAGRMGPYSTEPLIS
jgi:hypothetical protein